MNDQKVAIQARAALDAGAIGAFAFDSEIAYPGKMFLAK
jgi:hypothetical protein